MNIQEFEVVLVYMHLILVSQFNSFLNRFFVNNFNFCNYKDY